MKPKVQIMITAFDVDGVGASMSVEVEADWENLDMRDGHLMKDFSPGQIVEFSVAHDNGSFRWSEYRGLDVVLIKRPKSRASWKKRSHHERRR